MEAFFEVKDLSRRFGGIQAVREFNFKVDKGELVGMIGPNGAGKTTIFNCVTGFIKPDKGTIRFKGQDITNLKPHQIVERGITRTFQIVRPFQNLKVLDNVAISLISSKRNLGSSKSVKQAAMDILELVGISGRWSYLAKNLSHGDLKRLEIARALATHPELMLLDEPLAGLNPKELSALSSFIQELNDKGQTMVIIEHNLRALMKLVRRVVVVVDGMKIAEGAPQQIVKNKEVILAYMGEEYARVT